MSRPSIFAVPALLAATALALAACGQTARSGASAERPCARHGSAFAIPCAAAPSPSASASRSSPAPSTAPVFAYYYMWMQGSYWSTNKLDHPVQPFPGNYNSMGPAVINWQIAQAKAAGITGFLVSWKDNATYRKILPEVEAAATAANFKLVLFYESINAAKQPVSVSIVAADYKYFVATYASNPAWYTINGKVVTAWDGTQKYSSASVASVTSPVRSRVLVLSTGNNVVEYQRLAAVTDGDAYYWSSNNPATSPQSGAKLASMGAAVHQRNGVWISPFAPGFNATLIGGHLIVPRNNGDTLKSEYALAAASSPDILGLISWNEWTENTYVEPSVNFGSTYLNVLKGIISPAG
jgi:hypothetical protein